MIKLHIYLITRSRNKEIVKRMYSVVEKDYNTVVWMMICDIKTLTILLLVRFKNNF